MSHTSAVVTLFEGHYHYGLGALTNSLCQNGFEGIVWAGYRGELPAWADPLRCEAGYAEYVVSDTCRIRFVPLETSVFFSNYKPHFLLKLWDEFCPETENLFYFDPDIVIKCRWAFYENWVRFGTALCLDNCYGFLPDSHPLRETWKEFAERHGYPVLRALDTYYNGGFVGVSRSQRRFVETWQHLIDRAGETEVNIQSFKDRPDYGVGRHDRSHPFYVVDQDMLNLAAMVTDGKLSVIGPEGMDFAPAGFTMSHAVDNPKPWKKRMATTVLTTRRRPTQADRLYLDHTRGPIQLYSEWGHRMRWFEYYAGQALGMLIGRN